MNDAAHLQKIKAQRRFVSSALATVREKQDVATAAAADLKAHKATLEHARTDLYSLIDDPSSELPFPDAAVEEVGGNRKSPPARAPRRDHQMAAAGDSA